MLRKVRIEFDALSTASYVAVIIGRTEPQTKQKRVGVRAEEKVEIELMKYVKKVMGNAKLLYKLAKAAKGQPDGLVRNVIYPVVSETTLDDLIREAEAGENHEH
jgi:hypothetical protein